MNYDIKVDGHAQALDPETKNPLDYGYKHNTESRINSDLRGIHKAPVMEAQDYLSINAIESALNCLDNTKNLSPIKKIVVLSIGHITMQVIKYLAFARRYHAHNIVEGRARILQAQLAQEDSYASRPQRDVSDNFVPPPSPSRRMNY